VKIAMVTARFAALPALHKAIAALLTLAIAAGGLSWEFLQPAEYTSSAVLRFDTTANPELNQQLANQGPVKVATAILSHPLQAASNGPLDLSPAPVAAQDEEALREHLTVSEIAPNEVSLRWQGRDARQTLEATQGLADRLASWQPNHSDATLPAQAGAGQQVSQPNVSESGKEEALLKVTIAMLDTQQKDLTEELATGKRPIQSGTSQRTDAGAAAANPSARTKPEINHELQRIQHQRTLVSNRLTELQKEENTTQSAPLKAGTLNAVPATAAKSPDAAPVYAFTVVTGPTAPVPFQNDHEGFPTLGILGGLLAGLMYLAASLWWFRPITGVGALESLLPARILLVGSIAEIRR